MNNYIKYYFDWLKFLLLCGFVLSFIFSLVRLMAQTAGASNVTSAYCKPTMIDQLEPIISSRWFCLKDKE